jgi:hypothetical protein
MPKYPEALYPTVVRGVVHSDRLRLEHLDPKVGELYATPSLLRSLAIRGFSHDGKKFVLENFGPVEIDGRLFGVTHLQKQSRRGWLEMSPGCWHWWSFVRRQKMDSQGNWLPGTELGLYIRKGLRGWLDWQCWRWDVAGTVLDGELRHWIMSSGFCGGHWD